MSNSKYFQGKYQRNGTNIDNVDIPKIWVMITGERISSIVTEIKFVIVFA